MALPTWQKLLLLAALMSSTGARPQSNKDWRRVPLISPQEQPPVDLPSSAASSRYIPQEQPRITTIERSIPSSRYAEPIDDPTEELTKRVIRDYYKNKKQKPNRRKHLVKVPMLNSTAITTTTQKPKVKKPGELKQHSPKKKPVVHQIITKWSDYGLYTGNYNQNSYEDSIESPIYEKITQNKFRPTPKPVLVDINQVSVNDEPILGSSLYHIEQQLLAQPIHISTPLPDTIIISSPFPEPISPSSSIVHYESHPIGSNNKLVPDPYVQDSIESSSSFNPILGNNKCPTIHITTLTEVSGNVKNLPKDACEDVNIVIHSVIQNENAVPPIIGPPVGVSPIPPPGPSSVGPPIINDPGSVIIEGTNVESGVVGFPQPVQPVVHSVVPIAAAPQAPAIILPNLPNLPSIPSIAIAGAGGGSKPKPSGNKGSDFSGMMDQFTRVISWVNILNPFATSLWTSIFSPIAAIATGGLALAMLFFPWAAPGLLFARSSKKVIIRPRHKSVPKPGSGERWKWHDEYKTWTWKNDPRRRSKRHLRRSEFNERLDELAVEFWKYFEAFERKFMGN